MFRDSPLSRSACSPCGQPGWGAGGLKAQGKVGVTERLGAQEDHPDQPRGEPLGLRVRAIGEVGGVTCSCTGPMCMPGCGHRPCCPFRGAGGRPMHLQMCPHHTHPGVEPGLAPRPTLHGTTGKLSPGEQGGFWPFKPGSTLPWSLLRK